MATLGPWAMTLPRLILTVNKDRLSASQNLARSGKRFVPRAKLFVVTTGNESSLHDDRVSHVQFFKEMRDPVFRPENYHVPW